MSDRSVNIEKIQKEIIGTGVNSLGDEISKKIARDLYDMSEDTRPPTEGSACAVLTLLQMLYELSSEQLELTANYLRKKYDLKIEKRAS